MSNKFIDVDLNRASFGEVSVKAICELYRVKSGKTPQQAQKASFREMVEYLRNLKQK